MDDRPVTVAIVDDHPVVPTGIGAWFAQADPPIELIAAGKKLIDVWTGPGASADVVIFDLDLGSGELELDGLRRLVEKGRRVVVYTHDARSSTARFCIEMGALAYVTKDEAEHHLVAAVRAAANGEPYTPPMLSGALATDNSPNRPRLSRRETDALLAWFASSSKPLAAKMLHVTPSTVDTYIRRVRAKYAAVGRAAPTKTDLVQRALDDGLITRDELNGP